MVALTLLLAACGEEGLLDGLGERSHEYVEGSTTTTLPTTDTAAPTSSSGVVASRTLDWANVGIEGEFVSPEQAIVISGVWQRGRAEGRFIQASPRELWVALPGIEFPAVVPQEAGWVTSQLVFDAASGILDVETSAAFGIWSVVPYSDDEGRLAVLRVGQAPSTAEVGGGITSSGVEDGLSLSWTDGGFRYELFCVAQIPEEMCWQMVESTAPLDTLAPEVSITVEASG
jgi:hypothetical protein